MAVGIGELLVMGLPLAVGGTVVAVVLGNERKRRQAFTADFRAERGWDILDEGGLLSWPEVRRTVGRPLTLKPSSTGGKHPTLYWHLEFEKVALGRKTTLTLAREGVLGALREKLGFSDVQVGDKDFDAAYTIRGSDPDQLRGAFADPKLRAAVSVLFGFNVYSCRLDAHGTLKIQVVRTDMAAASARDVVRVAEGLADALDAAAVLPPRKEATVLPAALAGVGGRSGAPVGLPPLR
jgi:hypothetical protein